MHKPTYSSLQPEAKAYWEWSEATPMPRVPIGVAREGAASEVRTPLMHYGSVMPVYLAIARYLKKIKPKKGMRLVELGSGSGRALAYIKVLFPELEVWGTDYSSDCINYAKQSYGKYGVKFKRTTAQKNSLRTGYFNFVISSHVIEHIPEDSGIAFIKESKRILKRGGYAFIGTPERRHCQNVYAKNPGDHKKHRLIPPHEREYTASELLALGQSAYSKQNSRVDLLPNPEFYKVFRTSIQKFRPDGTMRGHAMNLAYRSVRDVTPRPVFDFISRTGAESQMKKHKTSYQKILYGNSLARDNHKKIAENLLLVCQK